MDAKGCEEFQADVEAISDMIFRVVLLLWLLNYSAAQNANCDFYQNVNADFTYYIQSPNYPRNYTPGIECRWIAACPAGYNCRLNCPVIRLPQSQSCSLDRLLVSRTGDPQLNGAETYCGSGSLTAVSTGQRLSIGLIVSPFSSGGRFYCQLNAVPVIPTPPCSCGEKRQVRIVGGQETGVNEYKMMVGLADLRISQIKCGGVIISNLYVVTAAHCIKGRTASEFAVVVGEHNVTVGDSPATKAYAIERFIIHPYFTDTNYDYDIAIVKVVSPIVYNDRVGPACLPFKFANTDFAGRKVTILGWGTLFPGGPNSKVLMKADLDVLSQATCRTKVPAVTDRQICTFTRGKDSCQDDSGGPLLYTDPATGLLFHVGIISFGRFCASEDPGVNTRITAFLTWIQNNTPPATYCIK